MIGSYHNIFRVGAALQDLGFWILNDIVWRKSNPMPNFKGTRFTNAHETLIWASARRGQRYTFNYDAHEDAQRRTADALGLADPAVHRRGAAEGRRRRQGAPDPEARGPAVPGDAGLHQAGRRRARSRSSAPAPPARWPSGWAAAGSASSASAAYVDVAAGADRRSTLPLDESALTTMQAASATEPRVPFGTIVESGLLRAGHDADRRASGRWRATVRADGSLAAGGATGSIHKVGAMVQGAPACNGWTYWHVEQRRAR